ncbi:hypothetical protein BRADI_3g02398v3 [Brachypodium distachyon]|uniref:Uncharacterized protein n=1 Tax=Brachypodium distachyon TaxID=15368 RepID=A0A0Q3LKP9_BRADI|nr:hypothetical protein BRADI_3g02398v3 [Brachypodium distachyon]
MSVPGKTSWPELVGSPAEPAVQTIHIERPDLKIVLLPVGAAVSPPGFHSTRVCVFYDSHDVHNRVGAIPAVG